jgi:hypothetical protein
VARWIGATYVPKIDGDFDDDMGVPVAPSGDLHEEVVAALEASIAPRARGV